MKTLVVLIILHLVTMGNQPVSASCPNPAPLNYKWCGNGNVITIDCYWGTGMIGFQAIGRQGEVIFALEAWRSMSQNNLDATFQFNLAGNYTGTAEDFKNDGSPGILFTYQPFQGSAACDTSVSILGDSAYAFATPLSTTPLPGLDEVHQVWLAMDAGVPWGSHPRLFEFVVRHEIGHALGMGHAHPDCPPAQLMHPYATCSQTCPGLGSCIDEPAIAGMGCLYGRWSDGCEPGWGVEWALFEDWLEPTLALGYCQCSANCPSASPFTAKDGSLTFELAVSESGGAFDPLATLDESHWVDDRYTPQLTRAYSNAIIRLRVFSSGSLVSEALTSAPLDLEPNATAVADVFPGTGSLVLSVRPNPFRHRVEFLYQLHESGRVTLAIYNLQGRAVRTLVGGNTQSLGRNEAFWDGRDERGHPLPAGVYFYRLRIGSEEQTGKLMLLTPGSGE